MRTSGKQCSFCLSRDPVHRVGSKCKPLMRLGMNVEINAQNFHYLFSFIKENSKKFDIVINTEVTNIIELINWWQKWLYVTTNPTLLTMTSQKIAYKYITYQK